MNEDPGVSSDYLAVKPTYLKYKKGKRKNTMQSLCSLSCKVHKFKFVATFPCV